MKWNTQAGKFITNSMVKVEFSLPVISTTKIVIWKCHVDDSTAGRYDMIISRYLLTKLGIYLKLSTNIIECDKGLYQGFTDRMENINDHDLEPINRNMRPFSEESVLHTYVNDCHESEPARTSNNRVCRILDAN